MNEAETKLIAKALYEIRVLLSSYIGEENKGPPEVLWQHILLMRYTMKLWHCQPATALTLALH
jgi:hypothetical protein